MLYVSRDGSLRAEAGLIRADDDANAAQAVAEANLPGRQRPQGAGGHPATAPSTLGPEPRRPTRKPRPARPPGIRRPWPTI